MILAHISASRLIESRSSLPAQTFPGASSAAAAAVAACAGEHGKVDGGLEGWVMTSAMTPQTPVVPSQ